MPVSLAAFIGPRTWGLSCTQLDRSRSFQVWTGLGAAPLLGMVPGVPGTPPALRKLGFLGSTWVGGLSDIWMPRPQPLTSWPGRSGLGTSIWVQSFVFLGVAHVKSVEKDVVRPVPVQPQPQIQECLYCRKCLHLEFSAPEALVDASGCVRRSV